MIGPSPPLFHPFSPSLLCAFRRPFHCAHEIGPETRHPLQTRRKRRDTPASFALATPSARTPAAAAKALRTPCGVFGKIWPRNRVLARKRPLAAKSISRHLGILAPLSVLRGRKAANPCQNAVSWPENGQKSARVLSELANAAKEEEGQRNRQPQQRPVRRDSGRLPCTRQEAARLECAPRRAAFRKRTAELPGAPHGRAPEARRDVPTTRGASQPFAQSVVQKPRIVERPRPIRARRAVY